jgi:hypothetical protein
MIRCFSSHSATHRSTDSVQASDIAERTLPPTLTDPFAGTFIATKVPKRARVAADRKFKRCTARRLVRQGLSGETIGNAKEAD